MRAATRRVVRSFNSAAARSVNVNATMDAGSAPSAMSAATRRDIASVLPDPAQAITWRSAPRWSTTSCWATERLNKLICGVGPC
jgi:hypothetical protein